MKWVDSPRIYSLTDDKLIMIEVSHFLQSLPRLTSTLLNNPLSQHQHAAVIFMPQGEYAVENFRIRGCNNMASMLFLPALFNTITNSASSAKTIYSRFDLLLLLYKYIWACSMDGTPDSRIKQ